MLICKLTKLEGKWYENMKKPEPRASFCDCLHWKNKKKQFRRRSNSPNEKTIMHEIWTRKIWNSLVFILLFEVLSGLQLDSDSQYFLKFDTHTFSNILHICNHRFSPSISMWRNLEGGRYFSQGGGEHLMFVCLLRLPFDPYSRDEEAATTKILDNKENVFSAYLYLYMDFMTSA